MIHTALARKYRPTRFSDLVAQEHVAAGLAGAIGKNRVAHAYLLTGPRGVGKTSAARILAMALNCAQRGEGGADAGEPCGACESCRRIWSGSANLDVVEIDAASNRGVDDARDLRERAMYAASAPDRFKVYIIDEAHMLTREAWNALLKILEEPPPQVVFVFATTEPQKIANTAAPVMSRLQRYDFRRMGPHTIVERLQYVAEQEGIEAEHDALVLMARVAHGGMRDAISLLDQAVAFDEGPVTAARVRQALGLIDDEMYAELLELVAERRREEVFPFVARLVEGGADLAEFVGGAGEALRALLLRILGGQPEGVTDTLRSAIERHAERYVEGDVLRMLKLLGEADWAIRRSPHARLHVETLLLQWTLLDRTVELQEVVEALRKGKAPAPPNPSGGASARRGSAPRGARDQGEGGGPARARRPRGGGAPSLQASPARSPSRSVGRSKAAAPSPIEGPLTLEALAERWPAIVEAAGKRRRLVREALSHAAPAAVEGDQVTLEVSDCEVHLEGLERSRDIVAKAVADVTGKEARVAYRPASGEAPPNNAKRLDREGDRGERLKGYRAKDPSLDAMADGNSRNHRDMADLSQLFQLGQQVQGRLTQMQTELAERSVMGSAGGGMVKVTADGRGQIRAIEIDPAAAQGGDVEMLEDLVLAAVSDAQRKAEELYRDELKKLTGGLPLPFQFPL
jgi:DNA polymerase-3 subunit gamma/tau